MTDSSYIIAFDIGTTACKTCLFEMSRTLRLVASESRDYDIQFLANGGAEQNPDRWWQAMCDSSKTVLAQSAVKAEAVKGISFCCQMQGLVLVDSRGRHLRPAMSYMDQRAGAQLERGLFHGLRIEGMNGPKLLKSLMITGAVAGSVKDPLWKYHWVRDEEPELFTGLHKWLDVKEYCISRCTGRQIMTRDSANATFLYDNRPGKEGWSSALCKAFNVDKAHLPEIVDASEVVGGLLHDAARDLGLQAGTEVFGGGGDASLIGIGAGAVEAGDTHIYTGTSGWVSTVVDRRKVDLSNRIASIVGAQPGYYNYFGEQETAGKCLEWVKDHLALDEINLYLERTRVTDDPESVYRSLYDFLVESISDSPPGAGGIIFTPWLHGNRSPFEDSSARGIFFNIDLNNGKRDMIRAVVEGIVYHQKWLLEAADKRVPSSETIRFVGGGALSPAICQIMADILEKPVISVENPQNAGAMGAAAVAALGMGCIASFKDVKNIIPLTECYKPRAKDREVYQRNFRVFKKLYSQNADNFREMNHG